MKEDAPQREHGLREVYNGLRTPCNPPRNVVLVRAMKDTYELLATTLADCHFVAFAMLMLHRFITFMTQSA